jgi:hypothetical protein
MRTALSRRGPSLGRDIIAKLGYSRNDAKPHLNSQTAEVRVVQRPRREVVEHRDSE